MQGSSSIDGIASGLNTTEIVNAIIQSERRGAVLMEGEQAEKTSIITNLKALQAKLLAFNTQVGMLTRQASFNKTQVTVSDDTYLSADAPGNAALGTFDLQVLAVARNHQLATQGFADASKAVFGTGTISIQVGDGSLQTVTIDDTNNSLVGIKSAINQAGLGVTATIINDGSASNPYRLMLSSDKTGVANAITVSSSLSGTSNLNFSTASFDVPEAVSMDTGSSSQISLGATASYTGSENKIYTFTVQGSGSQTVGTDNITIDWTDGTNSGSIVVSQADAEVALVGTGADGLKISLSAGTLTGGDTFQVQTFAPLLQEAADARIAFGSNSTGGSPIIVNSSTNTFKDVIDGVTLTTKAVTAAGQSVTVTTDRDTSTIKDSISAFIDRYNDVMDFIDKQNTFNADTKEGGVLLGDITLQRIQSQIRTDMASSISGLDGKYLALSAIGIRTGFDGKLSIRDSSQFDEAVTENLEDVIKLFGNSGVSSNAAIEFVSANEDTKAGENYEVDITQAATQGQFQGAVISDPASSPLTLDSSNNRVKLSVSGLESSDLILTAKTYTSGTELAAELQRKIDADENIGTRGLTVEWVDAGAGTGFLRLTTADYGSDAEIGLVTSVPDSALALLGLAAGQSTPGVDVAGTINGESATGRGQFLTGDDDNETTAGLKLKVTLTSSQLSGGTEGTISLAKGVASKLSELLDSYTKTGSGLLDSRIRGVQSQVDQLQQRIKEFDARLAVRRTNLFKRFYAMEQALGQFQAQSQFLGAQLANISSNFNVGGSQNGK